MKQLFIYIILSFIIMLTACGRKPGYVMSEKKIVDVLYDIQLAQAVYRNNNSQFATDEQKDALVAGVLAKHKISQADLDTSLVWYADNIKYYVVINDSVASRLRAKSNFYNEIKAAADAKTRRANMILPPFFYINDKTPTLGFEVDSFKIKTIDLPNFHLQFDVQGVNPSDKMEAAVFFTYKDTIVKNIIPIKENTHYSFPKPELPDSLLKAIYGYVHMDSRARRLPVNTTLYNISYIDSVSVSANDSLLGEPTATGSRPTPPASSINRPEKRPEKLTLEPSR